MHYFFVEGKSLATGEEVALAEEDLNHAYRVLRLKAGDQVALADGLGRAMIGCLTLATAQKMLVKLNDSLPAAESPLKIILCQSLLKGDKMDLVVRQAVELGVHRIIPLITKRSIPQREVKQDQKRATRWQSKVRSAAAQCRRAFLPEVEEVRDLKSVLPLIGASKALVPWEDENSVPLSDQLMQPCPQDRAVYLFVGPEGGFDPLEIEALRGSGAITIHLGPRILRSETAAAAVVTMVQAAWGDLSGRGAAD